MRLSATGLANTPRYRCGLLPECLISGVGFDCVQNTGQRRAKGVFEGFVMCIKSKLCF